MHCPPKWGGTDFLFPPISGRFLKFWGELGGGGISPIWGGNGGVSPPPIWRWFPPILGGTSGEGEVDRMGGNLGGNRGKNGVPPQDEGEISCSPPFVWFVPPPSWGGTTKLVPPKINGGAPNLFPPKIRDLRNSGGETYPREISVGGK